MILFKTAKYIFWSELISAGLILLSGIYDSSFWFYGTLYSFPVFTIITFFLFFVLFRYRRQAEIKRLIQRMVFVSFFLILPAIFLVIYLIYHPLELPMMG